jgi:2-iminobutanoate/2-iminopropanoate deaminase
MDRGRLWIPIFNSRWIYFVLATQRENDARRGRQRAERAPSSPRQSSSLYETVAQDKLAHISQLSESGGFHGSQNYDHGYWPGIGRSQLPFSDGILAGNTLYLSGKIGLEAKTGQAPADVDEEVRILLDSVKATLAQGGMTMDDLVYVQISCTDLSLFDKFNAAYRTYFTTKDLPARQFVGVASLLRGAHFELQSIAVRHAQ